jgi:hypothetical protein
MSNLDVSRIREIVSEQLTERDHSLAIALDFDGVCKLFTEFKHQVMFTGLFLNAYEFQRVPYQPLRDAYVYINFRSAEFAGKARFICVHALSEYLVDKGYDCALPGLAKATRELVAQDVKVTHHTLAPYADLDDVGRLITWSKEVDANVGRLTEIGLAPGIEPHVLVPFRERADFYVVSTATAGPLRASLEKEGIDYVKRYFGQETASKTEALVALAEAGYDTVALFGDSGEDLRAGVEAAAEAPDASTVLFVPIIPSEEARCFAAGRDILETALKGDVDAASALCERLAAEFQGREAGSASAAPMDIRD